MTTHNPQLIDISNIDQAKQAIRAIGSDPQSFNIMAPKMVSKVIRFDDIHMQDAIIIKQDMLSIGGEVAVSQHCFDLQEDPSSILISGTIAQLQQLVEKLKRHYKRLQEFAIELEEIIQTVI